MGIIGILLLLAVTAPGLGEKRLETYNIDSSTVTASGLSSGGFFVTQYHVVKSSSLMGIAVFNGGVYQCANGTFLEALRCITFPGTTDVDDRIRRTILLARKGKIDEVINMNGDRVYVFAGSKDTFVLPENGKQIAEYYTYFGAILKTEFNVAAEHCQPTDNYGPACSYRGGEYINNCNYNGAFVALNYLYGNTLTEPNGNVELRGSLSLFDQCEFYPQKCPGLYSADTAGFIYVPSRCQDKSMKCRLHVVFHGCGQGRESLGNVYATKTGYLEVAELNDIIILFPQTVKSVVPFNPLGCWDFYGYTHLTDYATKDGVQVKATEMMINRLING